MSRNERAAPADVPADQVRNKVALWEREIRQGRLPPRFSARDIYRRYHRNTTDYRAYVRGVLQKAVRMGLLRATTASSGGRPKTVYSPIQWEEAGAGHPQHVGPGGAAPKRKLPKCRLHPESRLWRCVPLGYSPGLWICESCAPAHFAFMEIEFSDGIPERYRKAPEVPPNNQQGK